jgi:hypothetical protein
MFFLNDKPLNDKYNCMEGDTLTLICEVNKPGVIAMWLKDGEQITVTDGYEITVDGCRHILTMFSILQPHGDHSWFVYFTD